MKRDINVRIGKNTELNKLIQNTLFEAGFKWADSENYSEIGMIRCGDDYTIYLDESKGIMYGDRDPSITTDSTEMCVVEFLEYLKAMAEIEVVLSKSTGLVTKKGYKALTTYDIGILYRATQKLNETQD